MRKQFNYILLLLSVTILWGCEQYLDKAEAQLDFLSEDDVWEDAEKIETIALRLYDCTEWFFETRFNIDYTLPGETGKNYGSILQVSGEVICTRDLTANSQLIYGDWFNGVNHSTFANPDFWGSWEDTWQPVFVAQI